MKISLIRTGNRLTAFAPGDGAISFIDEHDEVMVEELAVVRVDLMAIFQGLIQSNQSKWVSLDEIVKREKGETSTLRYF